MASLVGSMKNVKIFVLYLMQNVGRPLTFVTLNDIVMQTDYIMYLDFAEAFHKMLDDGLICKAGEEEGDTLYEITAHGRIVSESLHSDILSSILDKSLAAALRYLDFKKRGVTPKCEIVAMDDGKYNVIASFTEKDTVIFSQSLTVDTLDRAQRMKNNFYERPEAIYKGVLALMAGNVNYLFG